ncbi:hypothetical protein JTB14_001736, partial [Gonioctena quinquepunctata]
HCSEETVMAYKIRIRDMLEDQRIGPELRVQDFDEFLSLINGKTGQFIEQFLQADPPSRNTLNKF